LSSKKKFDTGLILSGGAVRGFAHLGAIQALHEHDVKPDIVAGSSAGSIAGAFYADGYEPEEILKILTGKKMSDYFRVTVPKTGFLQVRGLRKLLEDNLRTKKIEDLKLPLVICATELLSGKAEYFREGDLIDYIIASCSIPILFETKNIGKKIYVDGGILDNLPVFPLQKECKKLIGIHVNPLGKLDEIRNVRHIAERSFHLAVGSEINRKKKLFDIYIEPEKLNGYPLMDMKKAKEIYSIGYDKANEVLEKKKEKKGWKSFFSSS